MNSEARPVGAIVLCGGRSSRMQRDKASLPIGDETFLQRICRIIGNVASTTVVVAAADQTLPDLPDDVVIARDPVPDEGPLAGLLSGLQILHRSAPDIQCVWVGSCDAPFVSENVVRRLMQNCEEHDASLVEDEYGLHPLGAVYRVACAAVVEELVDSGLRRLLALPERLRIRVVPANELRDLDPALRCLRNINSPDDYDAATKEFERFPDRA